MDSRDGSKDVADDGGGVCCSARMWVSTDPAVGVRRDEAPADKHGIDSYPVVMKKSR